MKVQGLILGILLVCCSNIVAQNLQFGFQYGIGIYNMNSLKSVTEKTYDQLPFESKIISNYPVYFYYEPILKLLYKDLNFGILYTYQSTGSRISSKDYSGEYKFDSRIYSNSPGLYVSYNMNHDLKYRFALFSEIGINITKLNMNESINVDTVINNNYKFFTNSYYFKPGIVFSYKLKKLCFDISVGYFKEFKRNNFNLKGDPEAELPVKTKFLDSDIWDGFRFGITVSYTIF